MSDDTDSTIHQIEFELEKAEHGMALPYDAERVRDLHRDLVPQPTPFTRCARRLG